MNELWSLALSALGLFVSGYLLVIVQRRDSKAEKIEKDIKCLGLEISDTRQVFAYYCGKQGWAIPDYPNRSSSD